MVLPAPRNGGIESLAEPLLQLDDVRVSYGSVAALRGVSFEVGAGQIVALTGANGAGKSTLVRCIAGELAHESGQITVAGESITRTGSRRRARRRPGHNRVAVVWQDLALVDELDVAANLLLGSEPHWVVSEIRAHESASRILTHLGIPLSDTTVLAGNLSGGQRQMLALARAMQLKPDLLILDEPTAALDVRGTAQVEGLVTNLRQRLGLTVLMISHDIEQVFRIADRVVVLRAGQVAAEVDPADSHPDELAAIISGQELDSSARRQLGRLQVLADRLVSAEPSSGLSLILSALATALNVTRVCVHLVTGSELVLAGAVGLPQALTQAWRRLPLGDGPPGLAGATERTVVGSDVHTVDAWLPYTHLADAAGIGSSWSVPVFGTSGLLGVITVLRNGAGGPLRDEIDLVTLYGGYAATAIERERLLSELTSRNRVLETIRDVLEALAGPVPIASSITLALQSLRAGIGAVEVGVFTSSPETGASRCRHHVGADPSYASPSPALEEAARTALPELSSSSGLATVDVPSEAVARHDQVQTVGFDAPEGPAVLAVRWSGGPAPEDSLAVLEDAAHSLRLAFERDDAEKARQQTAALRHSQDLQQQFLSRLSHELRTPLTAIRGYAESLLQPDITWDSASQNRFLSRINAESSRLSRLVGDLLDFSAIESGVMRLQLDWCELPLVIDAARACLPSEDASYITLDCPIDLPVVWADHDRLEQVFVNLMDNAIRHNPPGTKVSVVARSRPAQHDGGGVVVVTVDDDGPGLPAAVSASPFGPRRERMSSTSGSGLGLSITRGIVDAHAGTIDVRSEPGGTKVTIVLPIERGSDDSGEDDVHG
jgi:signal transduction histidine kinase/ABC-type multidrug transport system ATPase subunit